MVEITGEQLAREMAAEDIRTLECVQAAAASVMGKEGHQHFSKVVKARQDIIAPPTQKSIVSSIVGRLKKMGAKQNG